AQVFICAAGMAAHLAGAVAANTTKPVLGVPLGGSALSGVDALYSTVQMPAGIPVATLAIGKAGAKNAAYLAVQILALNDEVLSSKLKADRAAKAEALKKDSEQIEVLLED
ncbi:AIR carboxylase family protein, partial [uncultured Campylobacter sp.]